MKKPIYLDYNSTSPVNEQILKEMLPIFTEMYGNPSNENHVHGEQARAIISEARGAGSQTRKHVPIRCYIHIWGN